MFPTISHKIKKVNRNCFLKKKIFNAEITATTINSADKKDDLAKNKIKTGNLQAAI